MRVTGLCGGIGAGKSTVADLFIQHGALIIDVDQIGREIIQPNGRAFQSVVACFGVQILEDASSPQGARIDRAKLAAIVFGDPGELARLEAISHPAINSELDERLTAASNQDQEWVVLDMAVLVESKLGQNLRSGFSYDTVVVVEASEATRVERLVTTRGMNSGDAAARIASQTDDATRRAVADIVLSNDGDFPQLAAAVATIVSVLSLPNL